MKRIILTLATALVVALVAIPMAALSASSSPYPKANPRPKFDHARLLKVPTRPCKDLHDYDWCFWDGSRSFPIKDVDEDGNEFYVTTPDGVQVHQGDVTYWAYIMPGRNDGEQTVCMTFLRPRLNRLYGGCALQSTRN